MYSIIPKMFTSGKCSDICGPIFCALIFLFLSNSQCCQKKRYQEKQLLGRHNISDNIEMGLFSLQWNMADLKSVTEMSYGTEEPQARVR